jgi:hypothetical protein
VACQASNPARSRVWFHYTLRHSLTESRRGLAQGHLRILDLLLGHGRLDFLDEALEGTQRCMVTVVPLDGLAGSANRGFMYNRHSRLL